MKLPAFKYASPTTLAEAISLLAASGGNAKPIAGGQSLIPVMAFRLAAPAMLIDLRRIPGLGAISLSDEGLELGASVRWRDIQDDVRLSTAYPLLVAAVSHIAHYQVRNRGTVGGSLAHADVAAELPGIAVTCDAAVVAAGPSGIRSIEAGEFFVGPLTTTLADDELVIALRLPLWPAHRRWAFLEFARQRGAFAIAGVALFYDEQDGIVRNSHIGVIGASSRLHRLVAAEAELNGRAVGEKEILAAARAAELAIDPVDDLEASADYRRALIGSLVERALQQARTRGGRMSGGEIT